MLKFAKICQDCADLQKFAEIQKFAKICHFTVNFPKIRGRKFPEGQISINTCKQNVLHFEKKILSIMLDWKR